jgi:hypothetical protein
MMSATLPRYRCHKIVSAFQIGAITLPHGDNALLTPTDPLLDPVEVSPGWLRAHPAEVGGYYVVYEDGYTSYSPAAAFESGYTRIEEP